MVTQHNLLRDILAGFCRKAHLPVRIEVGYGLGRVNINSRPANILIQGWDRGHPAAFDVTVTSPLTPATLSFSTVTEGAAAQAAEERGSMPPMTLNVRTCGGHPFLSQWSLMETGVRRLVMSSIALLCCLLLDIQAPPQHVSGEVCC